MPATIYFAGALLLSSAFLLARYCRRFTLKIKRRWQALSAGVAVAYVFVNVMPELEKHRPMVAGSALGTVLDVEKRIYLWALAGFVIFAGVSALRFRAGSNAPSPDSARLVYWGEMAGYSLYTMLIGYLLLHRDDTSLLSLGLFVFAMGLHLFMVDNELAQQFESLYQPRGEIILAACVLVGWLLGAINAFPTSFTSRLFAFVAGGVVITAHEERPAEESLRFWWFAGSAALYATLLMLI